MLTFGKYIAIGGVDFEVDKDNHVEKKQDKCDKKNASGAQSTHVFVSYVAQTELCL